MKFQSIFMGQKELKTVWKDLEEATYLQIGPWPKNCRDVLAREPRLGYTALHYAAHLHESYYIKELVKAGADVNAVGNDGMSPLLLLAKLPPPIALRGVDTLLKSKVNLFQTNSQGWGLLHFLAQQDNVRMLAFFIEKGLDLYAKTKGGNTPLRFALIRKNEAAAQILLDKMGNTDKAKEEYQKALYDALFVLDIKSIALLMRQGASLKKIEIHGKSGMDWLQENPNLINYRIGFEKEWIEIEQYFLKEALALGAPKKTKRI